MLNSAAVRRLSQVIPPFWPSQSLFSIAIMADAADVRMEIDLQAHQKLTRRIAFFVVLAIAVFVIAATVVVVLVVANNGNDHDEHATNDPSDPLPPPSAYNGTIPGWGNLIIKVQGNDPTEDGDVFHLQAVVFDNVTLQDVTSLYSFSFAWSFEYEDAATVQHLSGQAVNFSSPINQTHVSCALSACFKSAPNVCNTTSFVLSIYRLVATPKYVMHPVIPSSTNNHSLTEGIIACGPDSVTIRSHTVCPAIDGLLVSQAPAFDCNPFTRKVANCSMLKSYPSEDGQSYVYEYLVSTRQASLTDIFTDAQMVISSAAVTSTRVSLMAEDM